MSPYSILVRLIMARIKNGYVAGHRLTKLYGLAKAHYTFLIIALIFCFIFSIRVPLGFGNDESVHAFRAESISRGNLLPRLIGPWSDGGKAFNVYGNYTSQNLVLAEEHGDQLRLSHLCNGSACKPLSRQDRQALYDATSKPLDDGKYKLIDHWGANAYSFIGYFGPALGFKIASIFNLSTGDAVISSRLVTASISIAIITYSLYLLRHTRLRWIVFSASLMPITLLILTNIGVDSLLYALSIFLFASFFLSLTNNKVPRSIATLMVLAAMLVPLIKITYLPLSVLILFLPIYGKTRKATVFWRVITLGLILLPCVVWYSLSSDAATTQSITVHAGMGIPDSLLQAKYIILHPFDYVLNIMQSCLSENWIGSLATLTQQGYAVSSILLVSSLILLFSAGLNVNFYDLKIAMAKNKFVILVATSVALSTLLIITALYCTYNPVGSSRIQGVQGRYFLPIIPFAIAAFALFLSKRIKNITVLDKSMFIVAHIAILTVTTVDYIHVLG